MSEFWSFMAAPAASCLILSVLYTYFGLHVLKREIIFVDLSLAQLAALAGTTAMALNIPAESPLSYLLAFAFIVLGAWLFTSARTLADRVPQEAVIGIVYVVAASVALILANRSPHGAEHIRTLLNGSVLWTTWRDVATLAATGIAVSAVHFQLRHLFRETTGPEAIRPGGKAAYGADLLFFSTLGLVIVVSVKTAGVFLIFTLLIVPAVCGALFFDGFKTRWLFGAGLALAVSQLGLALSFVLDQPTGATLVMCFGVTFLVLFFIAKAMAGRR